MNASLSALEQRQKNKAKRQVERLLLPHTPLFLTHGNTADLTDIQTYVAKQFLKNYGAEIRHFFPYFLTSKNKAALSAAVGFYPAIEGKRLFLETYFDLPIQQVLANKIKHDVSRDGLVEIGNLTSTRRGSSYMLFILIAAVLDKAGFEWVVFTATQQVQHILAKLNIELVALGEANPLLLSDKGQSWGCYYDAKPTVLAANLADAMTVFAQQPVVQFMLENYADTINDFAQKLAK